MTALKLVGSLVSRMVVRKDDYSAVSWVCWKVDLSVWLMVDWTVDFSAVCSVDTLVALKVERWVLMKVDT